MLPISIIIIINDFHYHYHYHHHHHHHYYYYYWCYFKNKCFFYSLTGKLIKKKTNHSNTYFKLGYFICHLRYTISGRKPILSCRKPISRLECFIGLQRTVPSKEVVLIIQYSLKLTQTNFAELPFPHPLIIVLRNVLATLA